MQNSLPARPSLEQLKKLAKDLVRDHAEKQPEAIALIARHLPVLNGKSADVITAYSFALHDAQSVVARQYGFVSWSELQDCVEGLQKMGSAPVPDLEVAAKLQIVLKARQEKDYALFCSVISEQLKARVNQERFESLGILSHYFQANYQITYMGSLNTGGIAVHFWRMWVKGWETDLLIRMSLNNSGLISGLLYSYPFDTANNAKK